MKRLFLLSFLLSGLFFTPSLQAQWTSDTMVNLKVCDTTGGQFQPKVAYTHNGGLYVCWLDTRGGLNFRVYLQRLDSLGNKMFPSGGVLISSNPQSSSSNDYDLITDDSDNAIITFTDMRKGFLSPFAYKISNTGALLWGANGIDLNVDSLGAAGNPLIRQMTSGDYVVAWSYTRSSSVGTIAMQRLNRSGVAQWNNGRPLLLTAPAATTFMWQQIVTSENNFILSWSAYTSSSYSILSQKYDLNAQPLWAPPYDTVYNLGKVSTFYKPVTVSDKLGGAVYTWLDDRNSLNQSAAYVQHFDKNGTVLLLKNGFSVGAQTGQQYQPYPTYDPIRNDLYVVWEADDQGQGNRGIYAQKIDKNGIQKWTNTGSIIEPLGNSFTNVYTFPRIEYYNNSIVGSYIKTLTLTLSDLVIKAFKLDTAGVLGWGGVVHYAAARHSGKGRLVCTLDPVYAQYYMAWADEKVDADGVYAQNIYLGSPNLALGLPLVDAHVSDTILCAGSSFNLAYSTVWPYFNNNDFKVLLSNGAGSFGTADTLQTIHDSVTGTTTVVLPDTLSDGAGYKIRVIANAPVSVGGNLSQDMLIYAQPKVTLHLNPDTMYHFSEGVQLRGGLPLGGTYIGDGIDNTGFLTPGVAGSGLHTIKYAVTNEHGCSDTAQQNFYVYDVTAVAQLNNNTSLTIYPNPVQHVLFLKSAEAISNGHISVYNVLGQLVYDNALNVAHGTAIQINTEAWAAGMYAVVVENAGSKTVTQVAKQ